MMITVILLDAGPLGLVTHPAGGEDARRCKEWFEEELRAGNRICVPAIADYEDRRELFRADRRKSLEKLDELIHQLTYIPILSKRPSGLPPSSGRTPVAKGIRRRRMRHSMLIASSRPRRAPSLP